MNSPEKSSAISRFPIRGGVHQRFEFVRRGRDDDATGSPEAGAPRREYGMGRKKACFGREDYVCMERGCPYAEACIREVWNKKIETSRREAPRVERARVELRRG